MLLTQVKTLFHLDPGQTWCCIFILTFHSWGPEEQKGIRQLWKIAGTSELITAKAGLCASGLVLEFQGTTHPSFLVVFISY